MAARGGGGGMERGGGATEDGGGGAERGGEGRGGMDCRLSAVGLGGGLSRGIDGSVELALPDTVRPAAVAALVALFAGLAGFAELGADPALVAGFAGVVRLVAAARSWDGSSVAARRVATALLEPVDCRATSRGVSAAPAACVAAGATRSDRSALDTDGCTASKRGSTGFAVETGDSGKIW